MIDQGFLSPLVEGSTRGARPGKQRNYVNLNGRGWPTGYGQNSRLSVERKRPRRELLPVKREGNDRSIGHRRRVAGACETSFRSRVTSLPKLLRFAQLHHRLVIWGPMGQRKLVKI